MPLRLQLLLLITVICVVEHFRASTQLPYTSIKRYHKYNDTFDGRVSSKSKLSLRFVRLQCKVAITLVPLRYVARCKSVAVNWPRVAFY